MLLTEAIAAFIKNFEGRPRPCFFEECGYPATIVDGTKVFGKFGALADISKCTASAKKIKDALRSFPSGHSAHSMFQGMLLFLMLSRLFNSVKGFRVELRRTFTLLALVLSLLIPIIVGCSRIVVRVGGRDV